VRSSRLLSAHPQILLVDIDPRPQAAVAVTGSGTFLDERNGLPSDPAAECHSLLGA